MHSICGIRDQDYNNMILRESREKLYVIQDNINHYAGMQKIKQGALLSLDAQYMWNKGSGLQQYDPKGKSGETVRYTE